MKFFLKICGLAICIIIILLFKYTINKNSTIKKWVSEGALIVDVRTPEEFNAGNYKNSINIPLDDIEKNIDLFGDKNNQIIVYCRSGNRSGKAKKILKKHGYDKVFNAGAFSKMPD